MPPWVCSSLSLPSLLGRRRRRRILRKVLGPEMKFNWICIGIRLNRLCKHFVSFHLRAFRFLGSLTVNSAMWMCESFPRSPLQTPPPPPIPPHHLRRQFVAMSRLQLAATSPRPSASARSFCAIWFASSPSLFRFSFAKRKNYIEKPQELILALI